jgi:hypothetical protein
MFDKKLFVVPLFAFSIAGLSACGGGGIVAAEIMDDYFDTVDNIVNHVFEEEWDRPAIINSLSYSDKLFWNNFPVYMNFSETGYSRSIQTLLTHENQGSFSLDDYVLSLTNQGFVRQGFEQDGADAYKSEIYGKFYPDYGVRSMATFQWARNATALDILDLSYAFTDNTPSDTFTMTSAFGNAFPVGSCISAQELQYFFPLSFTEEIRGIRNKVDSLDFECSNWSGNVSTCTASDYNATYTAVFDESVGNKSIKLSISSNCSPI